MSNRHCVLSFLYILSASLCAPLHLLTYVCHLIIVTKLLLTSPQRGLRSSLLLPLFPLSEPSFHACTQSPFVLADSAGRDADAEEIEEGYTGETAIV